MPALTLHVNGRAHDIDVPAGTTLLGAIRDDLGLTGTRYGCGLGVCGACYVLVDGSSLPACTIAIEEAVGKAITTIEGLGHDGALHAAQRAFVEEDAMQCGYCSSGMIVSAAALLARTPHPSEDEIRGALASHLCRCGVYGRALRAVQRAAR
jgi:aerobic-type carbon monoxide dehydrogenase small subunit (CoxS/CutS family)